MLKVKNFLVCACMRLDSVDENVEGDENLHLFPPPPPTDIGLRRFIS